MDRDPSINVRLKKGSDIRHYWIWFDNKSKTWYVPEFGETCTLRFPPFIKELERALEWRCRFDIEIARLIDDGWTPAWPSSAENNADEYSSDETDNGGENVT